MKINLYGIQSFVSGLAGGPGASKGASLRSSGSQRSVAPLHVSQVVEIFLGGGIGVPLCPLSSKGETLIHVISSNKRVLHASSSSPAEESMRFIHVGVLGRRLISAVGVSMDVGLEHPVILSRVVSSAESSGTRSERLLSSVSRGGSSDASSWGVHGSHALGSIDSFGHPWVPWRTVPEEVLVSVVSIRCWACQSRGVSRHPLVVASCASEHAASIS